mmetsp:Transcript_27737/g.67522  ORF Transcript_27737/g.67522 Transcript_27737/m.67522 type:complete len:136 (-) Transcript_27737:1018-1425(-)
MTLGLTKPGSKAANSADKRESKLGKTELAPDKQMLPTKSFRASTSPTANSDSRIKWCKGALDSVCKFEVVEEEEDDDDDWGEKDVVSVKSSSGILVTSFPNGVVRSIDVPSGSSQDEGVVSSTDAEGEEGTSAFS